MQKMKFIWVGKAKASHWREAEGYYKKLLSRWFKIEEIVLKDAPGKLSPEARNVAEGERILAALSPSDVAVALDANGKKMTSEQTALFLDSLCGDGNRVPCFIVGGAYGLSGPVLARCNHKLSLSPMTFTHEMARVVLLEQLYRAGSILRKTGYHH